MVNYSIEKYLRFSHNAVMSKDIFNVRFGQRVKYFRNQARLSQEQLAEKLDCERTTIAYIEIGKNSISFNKLRKLCDILNIEPYQLFIFDYNLPEADRVQAINKLLESMTDKQLGIAYDLLLNLVNIRPDEVLKPI